MNFDRDHWSAWAWYVACQTSLNQSQRRRARVARRQTWGTIAWGLVTLAAAAVLLLVLH